MIVIQTKTETVRECVREKWASCKEEEEEEEQHKKGEASTKTNLALVAYLYTHVHFVLCDTHTGKEKKLKQRKGKHFLFFFFFLLKIFKKVGNETFFKKIEKLGIFPAVFFFPFEIFSSGIL